MKQLIKSHHRIWDSAVKRGYTSCKSHGWGDISHEIKPDEMGRPTVFFYGVKKEFNRGEIGQLLNNKRKGAGLTIKQAADLIGMSCKTYSWHERGLAKNKEKSKEILLNLERAINNKKSIKGLV